jgi:hypothetical protein
MLGNIALASYERYCNFLPTIQKKDSDKKCMILKCKPLQICICMIIIVGMMLRFCGNLQLEKCLIVS